jgi:beta-galactosidase
MLDLFKKANLTVLRVGESSWGNLETTSGKFNFGWLKDFLDEMHKRQLKAILGTSSYIVPQWLAAKHPEILWQYPDGSRANPMGRHAASRNHPLFRAELEKYISALGHAFKDHPAVIGWQLDNEIEANVGSRVDYNPAHKNAWAKWLKETYHTTNELNKRLGLMQWGLQTDAIANVPQPSKANDGEVPALYLANLHFERDNVFEYFRWQKDLLRKAGVKHWITTDLNTVFHTLADEPSPKNPLDISGVNLYQPTEDDPKYWASQAMFCNIHRSVNDNGHFIVTETRIGPAGSEKIWNSAATRQQFITWMIHPAAFGADGVMHWSGNRFTGGHWPHWGGMLDWSGKPEPDFQWVTEISAFYKKWGKNLIANTVDAKAAVLTDFDQRAALKIYPHISSNKTNELLAEAFDAFHRNGIGVDAIHPSRAASYDNLKKYKILVIASAPTLDGHALKSALKQFVENGGTLIVTPFTGYQTWDGVFRNTGFAADLTDLTGTLVRTVRLLTQPPKPNTLTNKAEPQTDNNEAWVNTRKIETSGVGMDGFTEILEVGPDVEVVTRFSTDEEIMNNLPALTLKKLGKGNVYKLAFWPSDNNFSQFIQAVAQEANSYLKLTLPAGVQAVPRTDKSFFIINSLSKKIKISITKKMSDRMTGLGKDVNFELKPYEIVWLE